MVDRIETGIHGLDELIEGGLPVGSTTLVSGGSGTGKTIFSCQFLWHGLHNGDNCLYITMEEDADDILEDAREFGWDFSEFEDEGTFKIRYMNPFRIDSSFDDHVRQEIQDVDADRVVIDSTSVIGMYSDGPGEVRRQLYELIKQLKKSGVTTVLTAEIVAKDENALSRYGVEEFVSDGVIVLRGLGIGGEMGRRLIIEKMRRTDFKEDIYPMDFTESGLKVEEPETGVSL
jgi:circadian clock protein KaiC